MVKNQDTTKKRLVKKDFEVEVFNLLKKGLLPIEIATHYNISLPRLQYYLSSLSEQKAIQKVGKIYVINPVGELKILSHKGNAQVGGVVKNKRGHAFIWKVKPNKRFDWEKVLEEANVYSEPKGIADTPRIMIHGRKVWLGQNFITIYEPEETSFFGSNAIESKKEAVFSMIETLDALKKALSIDFKYKFTCTRHHYGHIENLIAKEVIKEGKSYTIRNEKGYWLSIDFSQNKFKELEFIGVVGKNDPDLHSIEFDKFWNSHERTHFKVTPDLVLEKFKELEQLDKEFLERMRKESEKAIQTAQVLEQMQNNIITLTKEIVKLKGGNT